MALIADSRRPWHPLLMIGMMSLWLASFGNWPLWQALASLPEMQGAGFQSLLALGGILLSFNLLMMSLLLWSPWRKPLGLVLLALSASNVYFMQAYGVVIDPTMVANAVHTDVREANDLLSLEMVWPLLWGLVLPGWWWLRQPVKRLPWRPALWQQLALGAVALALMVLTLRVSFQDLATTMRNHKSVRYMINPYNTVYGLTRLGLDRVAQAQQPLQPVGTDARFVGAQANTAEQGPLLVLVVGETLRAANVGLGGYTRDTSPRLTPLRQAGELVYFDQVTSCGTNTQVSLPCMFSSQTRTDDREARNLENLLDVLQRAGLAVTWLDNQSGCKGLCDRVPNVDVSALSDPALCPSGACFDEVLIKQLPIQLQQLDPIRRARMTVAVLHLMGSHGPAYFKRTPVKHKHFTPECTDQALQNCDLASVINAYDNTARYTDHVLADLIDVLKRETRATALLFVSDHGESLGENGLYLHGMPFAMAPKEQTHVPMLAWLSRDWQTRQGLPTACLAAKAGQAYSHDNFFHTVLGLAGVETAVRSDALDMTATCRQVNRQ